MALHSPVTDDGTAGVVASVSPVFPLLPIHHQQLLTPPSSEFSSLSSSSTCLPDNCHYYSKFLNKSCFNSLLTKCAVNLVRILYRKHDIPLLQSFIVEILRRSKTSILLLQLTCYYLARLISLEQPIAIKDEKKLFVGLLIIASKFNQDYNFSFKAWLKICGTNNNVTSIQGLRTVERECLKMLDYSIYLNGKQYENWCNALAVFGYDFVASHTVVNGQPLLTWESYNPDICSKRFDKWSLFFEQYRSQSLGNSLINFESYFRLQVDSKVAISDIKINLNMPCKRHWEQDPRNGGPASKKVHVV